MVLNYVKNLAGIRDENIILAFALTIFVLLAYYVIFQLSTYINKTIVASSVQKITDKEVLEHVFKNNYGSSWSIEYSKNWMSSEAWDLWQIEVARNPNSKKYKGRWGGIDIAIIADKVRVIDIQMRDNSNLKG